MVKSAGVSNELLWQRFLLSYFRLLTLNNLSSGKASPIVRVQLIKRWMSVWGCKPEVVWRLQSRYSWFINLVTNYSINKTFASYCCRSRGPCWNRVSFSSNEINRPPPTLPFPGSQLCRAIISAFKLWISESSWKAVRVASWAFRGCIK